MQLGDAAAPARAGPGRWPRCRAASAASRRRSCMRSVVEQLGPLGRHAAGHGDPLVAQDVGHARGRPRRRTDDHRRAPGQLVPELGHVAGVRERGRDELAVVRRAHHAGRAARRRPGCGGRTRRPSACRWCRWSRRSPTGSRRVSRHGAGAVRSHPAAGQRQTRASTGTVAGRPRAARSPSSRMTSAGLPPARGSRRPPADRGGC